MTLDKDQDLKALFHNPRIPDVDLTGEVMRKLYAERNKKERFFTKYKVGMLVAAGWTSVKIVDMDFIALTH